MQRQRLEHAASLVEGHPTQVRVADLTGIRKHRRSVGLTGGKPGYFGTVDGTGEKRFAGCGSSPVAEGEVLQGRERRHGRKLPPQKDWDFPQSSLYSIPEDQGSCETDEYTMEIGEHIFNVREIFVNIDENFLGFLEHLPYL